VDHWTIQSPSDFKDQGKAPPPPGGSLDLTMVREVSAYQPVSLNGPLDTERCTSPSALTPKSLLRAQRPDWVNARCSARWQVACQQGDRHKKKGD